MKVSLMVNPGSARNVDDLEFSATLANDGEQAYPLNLTFLAMPALALQVHDGTGQRVPLGPPPVPPLESEQERVDLEPGQSWSFTYRGNEVFARSLPPGLYSVRFVHDPASGSETRREPLQSNEVRFRIEAEGGGQR